MGQQGDVRLREITIKLFADPIYVETTYYSPQKMLEKYCSVKRNILCERNYQFL